MPTTIDPEDVERLISHLEAHLTNSRYPLSSQNLPLRRILDALKQAPRGEVKIVLGRR